MTINIAVVRKDVVEALRRTIIAAAIDDIRPQLYGVCFHLQRQNIVLRAADGICVVETRIVVSRPSLGEELQALQTAFPGVRIALPEAKLLLRFLQACNDEPLGIVIIQQVDSNWIFTSNSATFTARVHPLSEETYTSYKRLWEVMNSEQAPEPKHPVCLNAQLLDRVMRLAPRHTRLYYRSPERPVLLTGDDFRAIIMPMTVKGPRPAVQGDRSSLLEM